MMQRGLVAAVLVLLVMAGLVGADGHPYCYYAGNTSGVYQDTWGFYGASSSVSVYKTSQNSMYVHYSYSSTDGTGCSIRTSTGDIYCGGGSWHTDYGILCDGCSGSLALTSGEYCIHCFPTMYSNGGRITWILSDYPISEHTVSGTTDCVSSTELYIYSNDKDSYLKTNSTAGNTYSFTIVSNQSYRLLFDGAYYDFNCTGSDVTFDYDACIWVYGYTCGIDTIKLYDDNSQLIETVYQASGYDIYEMQISDGQEYTISFYDLGIVLCYNQTFTCTGDHVNIDYDRCNWVYPPSPWADPEPIYIWAGYDYNIVVFRDEHGNFIENSQLAIYDKTDNQYLQRWTDATDGYTLLGARFATDHDVKLSLRTFDGIFALDTTYPANGSSEVGEENITTTNWTIPIKYNLNILPVDQYGMAMFDVFCGLSEYTPLNPGAFWGMDLSDRGYVPVTNCSGFSMCDIIAEKEGYADYKVEALNWTSKSALVKDYRHNIVMEEE